MKWNCLTFGRIVMIKHIEIRTEGGLRMAAAKTALVISAHAADFVWRAGGAIALENRTGGGLCARVTLPLAPPAEEQA